MVRNPFKAYTYIRIPQEEARTIIEGKLCPICNIDEGLTSKDLLTTEYRDDELVIIKCLRCRNEFKFERHYSEVHYPDLVPYKEKIQWDDNSG